MAHELLFAVVRVQRKLRRIEAKTWEATNTEGLFWATQDWEEAAWSEWATADGHAVATVLYDLLKAFDHVAYQKLIDAEVRTRFPLRQLKLLLQLHQLTRAKTGWSTPPACSIVVFFPSGPILEGFVARTILPKSNSNDLGRFQTY